MSLSSPNDHPDDWLCSTRLLDLDDPKLRIQAMRVTQLATTGTRKAVALHDFVKSLPFGRVAGLSHVSAAAVLKAGHGDSHTKGTLFVAMLRSVGVPARLRFLTLPSAFLRGIIDVAGSTITHVVTEVYLEGRWIQTDTYVTDSLLEAQAALLLGHSTDRVGYGIHLKGQHFWNGRQAAHALYTASDPASLPLRDWGVAHDPEQFYDSPAHAELAPGWLVRTKWLLAAKRVNQRVAQIRNPARPAGQAH